MTQVIKSVRNQENLEGLRNLFCEIYQHIIERTIKKEQLWNIDKIDFIHKLNFCKLVVSKESINVWSKCSDANFHINFFVCISLDKSVVPSLLIIPGRRLYGDVIEGYYIEGANITTPPRGFINSTLFLIWLELFAYSVPDSVPRRLVLVYYGYCSHYNDEI